MKLRYILTMLVMAAFLSPLSAQNRQGGGGNYKVVSSKGGGYSQQQSRTTYSQYNNSYSITMVYGLAAGVTCPILKVDGNNADVSTNAGFKGGMMWGVDFGVVRVVPELWYSTFKMDFREDGAGLKGSELVNRSIDFPIMVGFNLGNSPFRFNCGPSFSLMCKNTLKDGGKEYDYGRIKSNVGYVLGLSCDVISNLFLDLRYTGRFTANSNEWNTVGDPYNITMYTIDITAGVRF
ncbi:MAG: outer membrane beta-barrel protein [Rikenellaceae bacterium]